MKIEKLTPEQEARFPEFVKKWTDIGLSTEPADRPTAEEGIIEAYEIAGLPAPKIIWCGSPLSNALVKEVIKELQGKEITGDSVWDSVGNSVWASVRDSVWDSVGDSVWDSVGDSVRDSVGDSVRDSVRDSVGDSVRASVWASVRDSVWDSVWASGYGQHDANWLAFYDFFSEVSNLKPQTEKLKGLWKISKSAGWFIPCVNICFISERHTEVHKDEQGRLHCETGMAVKYPDGFGVFSWHGVRFPLEKGFVITSPEEITVAHIEAEENAEIRRVMIERYGSARYVLDSGAQEVQRDDWGILYRKEVPNDEAILVVKVVNSTPEPNGSFKDYWLRVPPTTLTAHEGVAWTFNEPVDTFQLSQQT